MSENITEIMRSAVADRGFEVCEYCRLPDAAAYYKHEADHVLPRKHGGETTFENMALSCWRCNRHKGTDVGSFDFEADGAITRFFNPRIENWSEHFQIENADIIPLTAEARVTVKILRINDEDRVEERNGLIGPGLYE